MSLNPLSQQDEHQFTRSVDCYTIVSILTSVLSSRADTCPSDCGLLHGVHVLCVLRCTELDKYMTTMKYGQILPCDISKETPL